MNQEESFLRTRLENREAFMRKVIYKLRRRFRRHEVQLEYIYNKCLVQFQYALNHAASSLMREKSNNYLKRLEIVRQHLTPEQIDKILPMRMSLSQRFRQLLEYEAYVELYVKKQIVNEKVSDILEQGLINEYLRDARVIEAHESSHFGLIHFYFYRNLNLLYIKRMIELKHNIGFYNIQHEYFVEFERIADEEKLESNKIICAICLEKLISDERIIRLTCSHVYHYHCLDTWLHTTEQYNRKCPYCSTPIIYPL